jgi:uncharacterized protein
MSSVRRSLRRGGMGDVETPSKPPGRPDRTPPPTELSESECFELLGGVDVGRLAVELVGGGVDIFPVNFVVHDGTVLLRTGTGTKLTSIEHAPTVAFEADSFDWYERTAWSVVVKGEASLTIDQSEQFESLGIELESWQPGRKPFFVRITPSSTTGRRFTVRRSVVP